MKRFRRPLVVTAAAAAAVALVAACSSSSGPGSSNNSAPTQNQSGGSSSVAAAYNNANIGFVNKSDKTGGTLKLAASGDCDSWDPANTYYAWCWNMQRLFTRTLIGYASTPGSNHAGDIVGDLAQGLGTHNAGFTQWTYKLKSGVKWQDGTPVTSQEIKYGIERIFALDVFTQGPSSYYLCTLSKCDASGTPVYKGPYKDKAGLSSIVTPDASTITFNLNTPYPDWNYIMAIPASAPVKTTEGGGSNKGANYTNHVLSDGPYMFKSYTPDQSVTWVRNPQWSQSTDTIRHPLVNEVDLTINSNSTANDQALQSGSADAEPDGGVQGTFQSQIVQDPKLKANTDDPVTGFTRYFAVYPSTIPNLHCRLAIFYAMNKSDLQKARGGSYAGAIANNMTPAIVPGSDPSYNPYPVGSNNTGDLTMAKSELQKCGKPKGFSIKEGYNPSGHGPAVFEASQAALARVGIKLTASTHAQKGYYGGFIGQPATVKANNIGIAQAGWGSDYPTGGGFWNSISASNAPPGGGNYTQINDKTVDSLLKQASASAGAHDDLFSQLDQRVMSLAVNLPFVYDKTLFYRNPRLTNVRINFGDGAYYDFVNVGVTK